MEALRALEWLVLIIGGPVVVLGPMVRRMLVRIPPADIRILEHFLAVRNQELAELYRLWFGGPWAIRRRYPGQVGRPYLVVGREADGSRWTHKVAFDGVDAVGEPALKEHVDGSWRPVLG